jgi:magnesium-transporting ATPase (P-type)
VVTFQSFRAMSELDWDSSTTFTRMVIAMAVNNKATRTTAAAAEVAPTEGGPDAGPPQPSTPAQPSMPSPGPATAAARGWWWQRLLRPRTSASSAARPAEERRGGGGGTLKEAAAAAAAAESSGMWLGDASDTALARYADELMPIDALRGAFKVTAELPFNSTHKVAITVVQLPGGGGGDDNVMLLKGAPERVVDRCTAYVHLGKEFPMDDAFLARWRAAYEHFGMTGQRVLGMAYKRVAPPGRDAAGGDALLEAAQGMVFLGLVALRDPPKPGVREAVTTCKGAGVHVLVVTGDHQLTAEAIARDVARRGQRDDAHADGVESVELSDARVGAAVISGDQLPRLTDAEWDVLLSKSELVFARTSPEQKLQIVKHLQRLGHVVAVTGDGACAGGRR